MNYLSLHKNFNLLTGVLITEYNKFWKSTLCGNIVSYNAYSFLNSILSR